MKSLVPIILAIVALLSGCEPEVKRAETLKPEKVATPTPDPGHIVCGACSGERYLMLRSDSRNADMRQSCPICSGRGFRQLVIPTTKRICADCNGMGAILENIRVIRSISSAGQTGNTSPNSSNARSSTNARSNSADQKVTCNRCLGSGLVFAAPKKRQQTNP